jgi:hypothetical protein
MQFSRKKMIGVFELINSGESMTRREQPEATTGSQSWLQRLINRHPEHLEVALRRKLSLRTVDSFSWLSPLEEDGFAEYQDEAFLERIGIRPEYCTLQAFWP